MKITFKDGTNDCYFDFRMQDEALDYPSFMGTVKFDGCTHLYNGDPDPTTGDNLPVEYMHLCRQFDELIDLLTAVRDEGRRRFAAKHPELWKGKR